MIADRRTNDFVTTFFTDKEGGVSEGAYASFNLGYYSGDNRISVDSNRSLLCDLLNIENTHLVIPNEVHGNKVMVVDEAALHVQGDRREAYFQCDALVTHLPHVCLGVTVADCVPVLFYDRKRRVVAAAHAGWKGIVAGVLEEAVAAMKNQYASLVGDVYAEVWPSISVDKFEVGQEVVDHFAEAFPKEALPLFVEHEGYAKPHINLREAVRQQLLSLGLSTDHIWMDTECTFSNPRYFSARRDGFASGRMVAGVFMRNS